MKKIHVAVIGVGHLGSLHLKVYSELADQAELVGICDTDAERALRLGNFYNVPYVTDYRELANRVDAVNICAPTSHHFEIARFFLQRRIHTFIEKPITLNVAEADELIRIAQECGVKLQVGHVERFNSAFRGIKHFTKKAPLFVECHRLNCFPNRSLDIGVVMDLMIHDIDIVLALNQCPVTDFHAVGVNVLTDREDIASVRLIFENGCVANLTASRVSDETMRKIRLFLPDSYISLDYVKQEAWIYKKDGPRILKHALPIEKEEPLRTELESFLQCIRLNTRAFVGGEEARDALDLALQITGQIVRMQQNIPSIRAAIGAPS